MQIVGFLMHRLISNLIVLIVSYRFQSYRTTSITIYSSSSFVFTGLGSSCTVDADCTTVISHSTCDSGVCSCVDGYTQQNDECGETKTKDPGTIVVFAFLQPLCVSMILYELLS